MAVLRTEDDLSHQQIEKDGSVAGKSAKSLTPVEEPTKAGGKVMHHVPSLVGPGDAEPPTGSKCAGGWGSPSIGWYGSFPPLPIRSGLIAFSPSPFCH
ncbi:hypothetical protein Ancab_029656 [Ancistrocladus abbreviatus]